MDEKTRKKIERHRIAGAKVPAGLMKIVKQQATAQLATELLKRYDTGELGAVEFVELIRAWVNGE